MFPVIHPGLENPMLNRKNRLHKNYKRHGYKSQDKVMLDNFRKECQETVEIDKVKYSTNMGNKLNNQNTSQTSYWEIINKVINKSKAPTIPPLLVNNLFILNCREQGKLFTDFSSQQCKPVINRIVLSNCDQLENEEIEQATKANGSDRISG